MKRELYFDCSFGQVRAAVMEDGQLCELHIEKTAVQKLTETVFYGRVMQIRPSVGAAFVDIGQKQNAFLPLEDGHPLRSGDMIIVQGAAKQATETKGLRITQKINLAGKWLVLIPGESGVHISKKIKDVQLREELLWIGQEICPDGFGLIVRTASGEITREAMMQEAEQLRAQWQAMIVRSRGMVKPGVLSESMEPDVRLVRDLAGKELDRIVTNDEGSYVRLIKAAEKGWIREETKIELYLETQTLIFDAFALEAQIDKAMKKRVWLPCGGYLIIDPCEALTVIDVNSGKMTLGHELEETALRVNLEAAQEAARQIRLRNIGGIIVIDFIDMQTPEHRALLEQTLREAAAADRCKVSVEGLTRLGLMEITRKRVDSPLDKALRTGCSYCSGTGTLLSAEETAQRVLRQIKRKVLAGQSGPFCVRCAAQTASALRCCACEGLPDIYISANAGRHAERFDIEQIGEGMSPEKGAFLLEKES